MKLVKKLTFPFVAVAVTILSICATFTFGSTSAYAVSGCAENHKG